MIDVDYTPIVEIIEDIFGDLRSHNDYKHQISVDCPVCSFEIKGLDEGDGKGNLEINYKYNVYKCWSCSESHETHGSLYKLIKQHGTKKQLKKYVLLRPDKNEDYKSREFKKVFLPKEFIPLSKVTMGIKLLPQYKQAVSYLKKRNIDDELIKKFNIGFCYTGPYENRIIIPSYDLNNEINYFVARSFLSKTKLKYKNPEAQKEIIIFNEHLINWDNTVYLVEGVFDSIFLPNSIPMLGKFLSEHLFTKLYENAKKIIIILDPDAREDQIKLFHTLNCGKLMNKVYCIELDGDKDLADLCGNISNYKLKQLE
jgi:DNA primase